MSSSKEQREVARHILKVLNNGSAYLWRGRAMFDVFPDETTLEFEYNNPTTGTTLRVVLDVDAFDFYDDGEGTV